MVDGVLQQRGGRQGVGVVVRRGVDDAAVGGRGHQGGGAVGHDGRHLGPDEVHERGAARRGGPHALGGHALARGPGYEAGALSGRRRGCKRKRKSGCHKQEEREREKENERER